MFDDYKKDVLKFYLSMKDSFELSSNLEWPTPKKVKKECFVIFGKRYDKKDDEILRSFFDPTNQINDHILSIKKFELTKFKPLISFMKGEKNVRGEENVKLLAWLLNFDSYEIWRVNSDDKKNITILDEDESILGTIDTEEDEITILYSNESQETKLDEVDDPAIEIKNNSKEFNKKLKKKIVNISTVLATVLYLGGYLYIHNEVRFKSLFRSSLIGQDKCMYWTGEHYEAIGCNETSEVTIPLDTVKLARLHRITLPDTLTKNSLGKVWYGKVSGNPIFYTAGGDDPLDSNKRLLPITNYIRTKYTSNYRYLLHFLTWSISFIALITLFAFLFYRFFSKSSSIPLRSSSKE